MKAPQTFTADQQSCIDALAEVFCGHHHVPKVHEFGAGVCVNYHGDLATFDFDRLTRLVIIAHKRAVRFELASSGPRMVRIIAHKRQHGDRKEMHGWAYHPNLSDLIEKIQKEIQP